MRLVLTGLALVAFVAIVVIRQGPPAGGDTTALTAPTSALLHGNLRAAATGSVEPDPPGYALFAATVLAPVRATFGSGNWCATPSRADGLRRDLIAHHQAQAVPGIGACGQAIPTSRGLSPALPPWYRAQAVVALLAWLVLAAGAVWLLRAAGAGGGWSEVGLVWGLALVPATSDAIVQLFHPQDLLCLGLSLAGVAAVLRRRWVVAGLLFGTALVTKQFALLVLIPTLVAVPGWRCRGRLLAVAAAVAAVMVTPLLVLEPHRVLDDLIGVGTAGAVRGATVVGLLGASPTLESAVARGAPLVLAVALSLWAGRRARGRLSPVQLVGLILACLAGRLVFESVIIAYYLVGASAAFLLLDLVERRLPSRALAWIAATALFVALPIHHPWVDALGTLALALVALGVGLATALGRPDRATVTSSPPVAARSVDADAGGLLAPSGIR